MGRAATQGDLAVDIETIKALVLTEYRMGLLVGLSNPFRVVVGDDGQPRLKYYTPCNDDPTMGLEPDAMGILYYRANREGQLLAYYLDYFDPDTHAPRIRAKFL